MKAKGIVCGITLILSIVWATCKKYEPYSGRLDDDFVLAANDTTGVRADGRTYITLTLTNTQDVKGGLKVSFQTDKGQLLDSELSYVNHMASTRLLLSQDTVYRVKATVKDGANEIIQKVLVLSFRPGFMDNEYKLDLTDTTGVRADGSTYIGLKFSGQADVKEGLNVEFTSSPGQVAIGTVAYRNKTAVSQLKLAEDTGLYVIRAKLKDGDKTVIEKVISSRFRKAYDESEYHLNVIDSTGIRADGFNTVGLRWTADYHVKQGLKIAWATSKGAVLDAELPQLGSQVNTRLRLAEDTGYYTVTAQLKDGNDIKVTKVVRVSFRAAYNENEYEMTAPQAAIVIADGISLLPFYWKGQVEIKKGLTVLFETDKGAFTAPEQPYSNLAANASLVVGNDTGLYHVSASLKDGSALKIKKSMVFNLLRAHPDAVSLELDNSVWGASVTSIKIKVLLTRNSGKVSTGEKAFYSAYQVNASGDMITVGRFTGLFNNVSQSNGQMGDVSFYADTQNIDVSRPIFITVSAYNDQGALVSKTASLAFKP